MRLNYFLFQVVSFRALWTEFLINLDLEESVEDLCERLALIVK